MITHPVTIVFFNRSSMINKSVTQDLLFTHFSVSGDDFFWPLDTGLEVDKIIPQVFLITMKPLISYQTLVEKNVNLPYFLGEKKPIFFE